MEPNPKIRWQMIVVFAFLRVWGDGCGKAANDQDDIRSGIEKRSIGRADLNRPVTEREARMFETEMGAQAL